VLFAWRTRGGLPADAFRAAPFLDRTLGLVIL